MTGEGWYYLICHITGILIAIMLHTLDPGWTLGQWVMIWIGGLVASMITTMHKEELEGALHALGPAIYIIYTLLYAFAHLVVALWNLLG